MQIHFLDMLMNRLKSLFKKIISSLPRDRPPIPQKRWKSLYRDGQTCMDMGSINEAGELIEESLEITEKQMGAGNWRFFDSIELLAVIRCLQGRDEESYDLCDRFLNEKLNYYGRENLDAVKSVSRMAQFYHRSLHYDKAAELYQRAIPLYECNYRPGSEERALLKLSYITLCRQVKKDDLAINLLEDLNRSARKFNDKSLMMETEIKLAISRAGIGDIDTAADLSDTVVSKITPASYDLVFEQNAILIELAEVLSEHGEFHRAESILWLTVEVIENFIDKENSPLILQPLRELAHLHFRRDNYEEAENILLKSMKIWNRMTREEREMHQVNCPRDLAEVYYSQGKFDHAEKLFEKELKRNRKIYEEDSLVLIGSLHDLAMLYNYNKKYKESENLLREIHSISEKNLGNDHIDTAGWKYLLGLSLNNQKRLNESRNILLEALRILEDNCDEKNAGLAIKILHLLGYSFADSGDFINGEFFLNRAIEATDETKTTDHEFMITSLNDLVKIKIINKKLDEAEEILDRVFEFFEERDLRDNLPDLLLARSLFHRARCFLLQKRYQEAEPIYYRSMMIFEKREGKSSLYIIGILKDLNELFLHTGRLAEAKANNERLLELSGRHAGTDSQVYNEALNYLEIIRTVEKRSQFKDSGPGHKDTLH
ncbi:MAG: tetratricopeptide repeat protein [Candidatus Latescibacteria bacterium]|nr:tetratricopeptide repeat protein [bacterium]MBD3424217.1 tetratricopeptide repeat protein [Candidatus Latescibacterota bacterium]